MEHVDERDDQPEAGFECSMHPTEPEQNAPLVLLDDPHRHREEQQQDGEDHTPDGHRSHLQSSSSTFGPNLQQRALPTSARARVIGADQSVSRSVGQSSSTSVPMPSTT